MTETTFYLNGKEIKTKGPANTILKRVLEDKEWEVDTFNEGLNLTIMLEEDKK
jgi:hypothetical protein